MGITIRSYFPIKLSAETVRAIESSLETAIAITAALVISYSDLYGDDGTKSQPDSTWRFTLHRASQPMPSTDVCLSVLVKLHRVTLPFS